MKILVKTISGPKSPLEIESWETLDELKQKIFQTLGVPPDQQSRLVFAGRKLGDGLIADQIHRIQSTPHRDELLNRLTESSIESSTTGSGSPLFNILLVIRLRGGGNVVFHRPDQSDCDSDDDDDVVVHNALMSCSNETTTLEEIEMEESTSSTPPMKRRFFSDIADSMLRRGYTRSQLAKLPRLVQDRLFSRARKGVVWDPYQEHREQHPFEEVAFYSGYIKCFDAISAYHPERVLRQFGLVQTIPSNPLPPISKRAFQMVFLDQFWERWESHVLSLSARGERASQPWDVATSSYLHWYGREVRMSGEDLDKLKASLYNADPNRGNVDCVE